MIFPIFKITTIMIIFKVVLKLPGGSVWAVVFFFMLVTIGIDSEFCIVESLVTGIVDMWPEQLRPKVWRS